MTDPVLVEVTRGGIAESVHAGAWCVTGPGGQVLAAAGNIDRPVFPRSAIKAFQCLPLIESGAAERFGFTDEEVALACSSHNGEPDHVRVARAMLAKAGHVEADYECGAHWPARPEIMRDMVRRGEEAGPVHNNCSGKHAGMLALARALGADSHGYVGLDHPVQRTVAAVVSDLCDCDLARAPCGIDGCSVPTWAIPLRNLALGFQRLAAGETLADPRAAAARRIVASVAAHPFMVAGSGRFCTRLMQAVPRAFVKTGAEGVFCGCVPHAGIGIALKCDDGAGRAAEIVMAGLLARLPVWTPDEAARLAGFTAVRLDNWRGLHVGDIRPVAAGFAGL